MASEIKSSTCVACQISLEMLEIWKCSAQLKGSFPAWMPAEGSGQASRFAGGVSVFLTPSRHSQALCLPNLLCREMMARLLLHFGGLIMSTRQSLSPSPDGHMVERCRGPLPSWLPAPALPLHPLEPSSVWSRKDQALDSVRSPHPAC